MTPTAPPAYLSVDAFRARYNIGTTRCYELIAAGAITARKYGRKTLIETASADAYFAALPPARLTTGQRRHRSTTSAAEAAA